MFVRFIAYTPETALYSTEDAPIPVSNPFHCVDVGIYGPAVFPSTNCAPQKTSFAAAGTPLPFPKATFSKVEAVLLLATNVNETLRGVVVTTKSSENEVGKVVASA
jgi:hypothetical protein